MKNCIKCQAPLSGEFCSQCGHAVKPKRIDKRYLLLEVSSILNFERGILYTIKELLVRPGQNIRSFIIDDRNRLVKPIIFIVVCSLIYTIVIQAFDIRDGYIQGDAGENSAITHMLHWVQGNYGYANIIMSFFIAMWVKIFFRKHDFNFFEILILLCFVMGMGMLIFTFFALVNLVINIPANQIFGITGVAYCAWAIGQFFEGNKFANFFKAFIAYMLGMLSVLFAVLIAGSLYDLI